MKQWKKISAHTVLHHGKFLTVEEHVVELPDGRVIDNWPVIATPDYVNMLIQDRRGLFLFFRQTKYVAPDLKLSPPGGYMEPGELPLDAARRELLEETGYTAEAWHPLGRYIVDGNRGCGAAHLFLALNASPAPASPITSDDLEDQELVFLTREEVESLIDNQSSVLLSISALLSLGLRKLDRIRPDGK